MLCFIVPEGKQNNIIITNHACHNFLKDMLIDKGENDKQVHDSLKTHSLQIDILQLTLYFSISSN